MIVKLPIDNGENYVFVNTDNIAYISPKVSISAFEGRSFGTTDSFGTALGSSSVAFPVDNACQIHFIGNDRPIVVSMTINDLVAMIYSVDAVGDEDRSDLMEGK